MVMLFPYDFCLIQAVPLWYSSMDLCDYRRSNWWIQYNIAQRWG